jgi:hypothetical protein
MNDNSEVFQQILLVFLGRWYEEHTKIPSIMGRLEDSNYRHDLIRRMPIYSKLFEESTAEGKEKLLETFAIAKAVSETIVQSRHILR